MWYALFVNGMFYSAYSFAEACEIDIQTFKQAAVSSGVPDSLNVRFVSQREAARLFSGKSYTIQFPVREQYAIAA